MTGSSSHAAVANALVSSADLPERLDLLVRLFSDWTIARVDEALDWLSTVPDAALRLAVLEKASAQAPVSRPAQSLPLALALPKGADRHERIATILRAWSARDRSAASTWARRYQADPDVATAGIPPSPDDGPPQRQLAP